MRLHETKKFLYNKANSPQTEETAYRMGEIFVSYTSDMGLITKIHRELKKLTSQRIDNSLNQWANKLNRQLSKVVQMANKHMKKCSTSLTIKEMQIKTTLKFHLTQVKWLSSITQVITNAGEDVGNKALNYTVGGNVNSHNCYGKQYGGPSKN
jgi:gas vesicle protein